MVDNCAAMECSKCHNLFETNNFFTHLTGRNGDGCQADFDEECTILLDDELSSIHDGQS